MTVKLFEIRDRATFISTMAIKLSPQNEAERYLLLREGFGNTANDHEKYVLLTRLVGEVINYDPYEWPNRTMYEAHKYIKEHFDELENGAVIDVEFILNETDKMKVSEACE